MHTPNPLNLLYFHPHKMRFSPVTDIADGDRRSRWFPTHSAWVTSLGASPLPRQPAQQDSGVPKLDLPEPGRTREDLDSGSHR
jgi:hypothetical protein